MAEHESTEVVPTVTQPMVVTQPMKVAAAPATFDLGRPVADLDSGREPVTWAGGSLELVEVAEHRPTSVLDRDPVRTKWMVGAIAGSVGLALILGFAFSSGSEAEAGEDDEAQAAVEIPSAPEPEPAPVAPPPPEPEPKKAKSKKASRSSATHTSTLAAGSEQAVDSSSSKPGTSKPAPTPSKPAASPSKPAATPSKPAPAPAPTPTPSKPAGPNLAPPEEDASTSKAELPDVSGWDDQDAALGDRTAEGV